MFYGTSKERFKYYNTLLCLVKTLKDNNITIDLRNDSYVCGQLISLDGCMNLSLSNAVYCDSRGMEYLFENLFVQSRNIRYIHIPESIPILPTLKKELGKYQEPVVKKPKEMTRKKTKALKQHLEVVASLDI